MAIDTWVVCYPYWVFASFFVKVTEFLVDVSRCKKVWWRLLHPETLQVLIDIDLSYDLMKDSCNNLFFLPNSLRSSTRVAFNTVQYVQYCLYKTNILIFYHRYEVFQAVTKNCWHLNDCFYYHVLTYLISLIAWSFEPSFAFYKCGNRTKRRAYLIC